MTTTFGVQIEDQAVIFRSPRMNVSKLQAFFYDLLRDAAPAGEVERIVREAEKLPDPVNVIYSNTHLANYALELARRFAKAVE